MKVEDIIRLEDSNEDSIILLKEGMFWRSYERSAFRFCTVLQEYKVMVRNFKNAGRTLVYLGFPDSRLDRILEKSMNKGCQLIKDGEGIIRVIGSSTDDRFAEWKENLLKKQTSVSDSEVDNSIEEVDLYPISGTQQVPVYKASYDLMLEIYQFSKQFHREYRFTLGERLKNEVLNLLIGVYQAQLGIDRMENIRRARNHTEIARLLLRITHDLHLIELKRFIRLNENIEDILRQLSGWLKAQRQCRSPVGGDLPE